MKYNWIDVQKYIDKGHTFFELQKEFGMSRSAIFKAKTRGDLVTLPKRSSSRRIKKVHNWNEIQEYYDKGFSVKETAINFKISVRHIFKYKSQGKFKTRSKNDAAKIRNKIVSPITKKKISEAMKLLHSLGKAHTLGHNRNKQEPSYPEKFFMKVIENEFDDKNYQREFPFSKFSLDFAWVEKKKCIEIDGEQHDRFEDQKRRDLEKDQLLKENNWQILRIKWKDLFKNSKYYIIQANNFIGR